MDEFADEFGDDPLLELLGDDLDALEQTAFQATQATKSQYSVEPLRLNALQSQSGYDTVQDGDYDDEVIDTTRNDYGGPAAQPSLPAFRPPQRTNPAIHNNERAGAKVAQAGTARAPLQRTQSVLAHRPSSQSVRNQQDALPTAQSGLNVQITGPQTASALQVQVQELLRERDQLRNAVQEANKQVLTKTGEIAIVRSNYDRSAKEKEEKLIELQREVSAANERHKAELEQARKQQEQLTTESRFADHDRVIDRTRRRKQQAKLEEDIIVRRPTLAPAAASGIQTPRTTRQRLPGDGFSAQERSPSKLHSQLRELTPKAAEKKRKRLDESTTEAFLSDGDVGMSFGGDELSPVPRPEPFSNAQQETQSDVKYNILQRLLNNRASGDRRRTLEVLAEHKFPSDLKNPLSTLIMDGIAKIKSSGDAEVYTVALCAIVVGLWSRCLLEKFYHPIQHLSDLMSQLLRGAPTAIPSVMDDLVSLLQKTADVNLIPRFRRSLRRQATDPGSESEYIDATECLEILIQVVTFCDDDNDLLERFWTLMRVDFLSMLLRPAQDIDNIMLTCSLLSHGVRADGLGPVLNDNGSQPANGGFSKARAEDHLVDRLSALLIEMPREPAANEPYTQVEIAEMRLEVLSLIERLAWTEYSANLFTRQTHAVGRLVRCMNDEFHDAMELLYGWEDRMQVINQATRLLYHFVYRFGDSMDINEKLRAIPGGAHKYLIVLTRLAFSEGSICGSEVDEDVVDCAHELLEDHVNPEEGEALMAAFQSDSSRR